MSEFCEFCGVSEELHDGGDASACDAAEAKARLLERFWFVGSAS